MIPTSYDNLGWADSSLVNWPNWIEYQVVPNLQGSYGRGVLPGYSDSGEIASSSLYPITGSGYPEMLQPAPYSNSYGVESQPRISSLNMGYGTQSQDNKKAGWNNVQQEFGYNSTTLQSFGSVVSDILGGLNKQDQYKQAEIGYQYQADALRNQAESSYKVAGVNMSRLRGNQESYLAQQRVSGVRTGFAPTSGSIEAVQRATMSKFEQQIWDAEREAEQNRQSTMYQSNVASWRSAQARKASKRSGIGMLGSIAGATIGAFAGGPTGMAIGSKIGSSLGNFS